MAGPSYSAAALIDTAYYNQMSGLEIDEGSPEEAILIINVNSISILFNSIVGRPLINKEYSYLATIPDPLHSGQVIPNPAYNPKFAILDGPRRHELFFPAWPVTKLVTFMVNGVVILEQPLNYFDSDNTIDDGYFLYPHEGKLTYIAGFCHGMKQNIYLDYFAGFGTDTDSYGWLQLLCYQSVVKVMALDPLLGDIDSSKIMDFMYKKIDPKTMDKYKGLIPEVWRHLMSFRRPAFS